MTNKQIDILIKYITDNKKLIDDLSKSLEDDREFMAALIESASMCLVSVCQMWKSQDDFESFLENTFNQQVIKKSRSMRGVINSSFEGSNRKQ